MSAVRGHKGKVVPCVWKSKSASAAVLNQLRIYLAMPSKVNLVAGSVLRGLQMLFSIVVIGLSVTLVKDHIGHRDTKDFPGPLAILPLSTGIGAVSLVAAVFSFVIAWTNFLHEYFEIMVDVVTIAANVVGGIVCIAWNVNNEQLADIDIGNSHQSEKETLWRHQSGKKVWFGPVAV
jgi:hypothetical protein